MAFSLRWLGQGGFELSDGRVTILLDPYLSDLVERVEGLKRLVPPPILPQEAHPDLFLITHDHLDHLDVDTIAAMDKEGVRFAAPGSCLGKLVELGVKEKDLVRLDRGSAMTLGEFYIEAVYAKHTADSLGFVLSCAGIRAYFSGDTELDESVGRGFICDILFVCINGRWGNMGISEALQLAGRVQAKAVAPHHYGMFAENDADPRPFISGLLKTGRTGFEMQHGQTIRPSDILDSSK